MWKTRRDFEAELIAKTWEDKEFREKLLQDPKAMVEKLGGEKLPSDMKVTVLEETANQVYLVIPRNPDDQLSEAELSTIAGGVGADSLALYQENVFTRF